MPSVSILECGVRNVDCQVGYGYDSGQDNDEKYVGYARHTNSSTQCQKWSFQDPHKHGYDYWPEDYCRNQESTHK